MDDSLERLRALRGVTWRWGHRASRRTSRNPAIGVVAQDVEKVFPELVSTGRGGYKQVHYAGLIGPLIEAVKELDQRLSAIEVRLDAERVDPPRSPAPADERAPGDGRG